MRRIAAGLLIAGVLAGCGQSLDNTASGDGPVVTVASGQVQGKISDGYRQFAGIPYAAPPVGPLRWKAPADPATWTGVRGATDAGAACPQADLTLQANPGHLLPMKAQRKDEDCLTLNVWTPASAGSGLPVLVWIHGGAFLTGSGANYAPVKLVTRGNLIVVTINYRLGGLGFLNHSALSGGRNAGFLDQQTALKWVQRNISAFGGDPAKVTIAGGSAGAMSVCAHLAAPGSAGLFRAAILQSGPCLSVPDGRSQQASNDYAGTVGCPDPAAAATCLTAAAAENIGKHPFSTWSLGGMIDAALPTGDGTILPATQTMPPPLGQMLRTGPANSVPVIIGSNHDETTSPLMAPELSAEEYLTRLRTGYFEQAEQIAAQYPAEKYNGKPGLALGYAVTDGGFACNADAARKAIAAAAPVYGYELSDPDSAFPAVGKIKLHSGDHVGSYHGAEIGLLFDTGDRTYTQPQQQLSDTLIRYWAAFVTTTDPNTTGLPSWPRYAPDTPGILEFKPDSITTTDAFATEHQCAFWEQLS